MSIESPFFSFNFPKLKAPLITDVIVHFSIARPLTDDLLYSAIRTVIN